MYPIDFDRKLFTKFHWINFMVFLWNERHLLAVAISWKSPNFRHASFPVEWHQKGIAYVLYFLQKIRRRISWVRILHLYLMAEDILELLRNIFWGFFLKKKINSVALSCSSKLFSTRPPIIDSHSNSRHLQSFLFEISECACDMAKIVFSRWVISFRRHKHFRWALHLQRSNHRRVQWGILQRSHFPFCSPQPYSNPAAGRHTLIFRYVMSSFFFFSAIIMQYRFDVRHSIY